MKPKEKVADLKLDLINDTQWELSKQSPDSFTLIVFYRGLHCPICKGQLESIANHLSAFSDRGVNVLAVSMDTEKRAKITGEKWDIKNLPVGYNLSEEKAREFGLYISEAIKDEEPDRFSEPGMFLVKPDGTLYCSTVQTMPFARPQTEDLLKAIDFVKKEDYPARGEA